jgi:hypothetical protein
MSYSNVVIMKDTANMICKEINALRKKASTPETAAEIQTKEKRVLEIRNAIACYKRAYGLR